MVRTRRLEVQVAVEVVREEAHTAFEREELSGERKQFAFLGVEEVAGGAEIALGERFEVLELHGDLGEIDFVFLGGRGRGADHVAEVVERGARHRGVEVDNADAFERVVVDEHVVQLRVLVRDAFRDFAVGHCVEDDRAVFFAGEDEVDFLFDAGCAVLDVGGEGLLEGFKAFARVVEVRNRFDEAAARDVHEELLEVTEGACGLEGLFRRFDDVVAAGAFDEDVAAPDIAFGVHEPILAGFRRDERERAAGSIRRVVRFELVERVAADTGYVFHQSFRIFENVGIDALEDVADAAGALVKYGAERIVDVTASVGERVNEVAVNGELSRDGGNIVFRVFS